MFGVIKRNFDTLVLAVAVILVWRGVWGIADLYLVPEEPTLSFLLSFLIGVIILFIHNPKLKDIRELL